MPMCKLGLASNTRGLPKSTDPKEGITAIQGLRNGSLGATILGTAAAQLASRTLAIMTNPEQLQQVAMFGNDDPITGGEWAWCDCMKLDGCCLSHV